MAEGATGRLRTLSGYEPVAIAGGIWLLAKFLRYAFPPLFPTFRTTLSVPNSWLGSTFAAMLLLYSAMQFPSGALADRLDDVRVVAVGAGLAVAGSVVLLLPPSVALLVVGMSLVGLGTGVHKTVSIVLLSRLYPDRTGRALGVFDTFGTLGGVLAPAAVVAALSTTGWQTLFLAAALAGAFLLVALLTRVPRDETARDGPLQAVGSLAVRPYLPPFRWRRFQLFVGATLCFSFAYNGTVAFLPLYLVEVSGLAATTASLLYSVFFAASVVQIPSGWLADRYGRLTFALVTLGLAASSLAALVVVADAGALVFGCLAAAFGIGSHGFRPVRGAHLSSAVPSDIAGGGLGLVRTLLMGAGAVAPAVVGVAADVAGFRLGFALLAASMAGAALLVAATFAVE
jgi:MFS family permease